MRFAQARPGQAREPRLGRQIGADRPARVIEWDGEDGAPDPFIDPFAQEHTADLSDPFNDDGWDNGPGGGLPAD